MMDEGRDLVWLVGDWGCGLVELVTMDMDIHKQAWYIYYD